jgi:prepilin-type N-terminal cleavage/methylation domain-containing protein
MTARRGFTLVEMLVALVLMGLVGTAIYQLLVSNQRLYRQQTQRVEVNENARAAMSILPGEIRELDAGDPAGSDVVAMTGTALTYKAMRSLYVLCQPPNTGALQLTVDNTLVYGLRRINLTQDSVVVFAENDPMTRTDDQWLHANVTAATVGTACPGGGASLLLTVSGITAGALAGVQTGAPLRGFEVSQVLLYTDAAGDRWLGGRTYQKSAGTWSGTQPIVGPLSSTGLQLTYYDGAGAVTALPGAVARVAVTVESKSSRTVRAAGGMSYLLQDLVTQVAVRNNPSY